MVSPTLLDVSRWQFVITIVFHMTFPAITVGLSVFLTVVYGLHLRTGHDIYLQIFRFWKRIFAVGFGLGVVSGTVITFELGLNWGRFASATGPILGPIIGMEVVSAFFVEAAFIGVMLYGDGRVKPRTMFLSCCMVALGTVLSTLWILAANSWMQTPAGYRIDHGRFVPDNWWSIIFNPSFSLRFPHMLLAVIISAALFVGGIAAYYLIRKRHDQFARRTFSIALGVLALLIPVQVFYGDKVSFMDAHYQMAKFAAFEGDWDSTNTGYNLVVVPDQPHQRNRVQISVPKMGSVIRGDLSGHTPLPGQLQIPRDRQPNSWSVFWGFRVMFYAATVMLFAAVTSVALRLRGRLFVARWFHRLMLWLTPLGVVAIIGGWVTAETGRQPYLVYGMLRTDQGFSLIASPAVLASFFSFLVLYLALFGTWIAYVVRTVRRGPDPRDLEIGPPGSASVADVIAAGEAR